VCVGGGVRGVQLGSLVWPLGLHHKGSMPGLAVWSLITHTQTTGPFVVACVPATACCRACFKCSLCVTAPKEQRRSVRAARRSAAVKNTTWRERVMWELKDSIQSSLKSHPGGGGRGGGNPQ